MIFQQILSGGDRNFGYLVACEHLKRAAVVDPSPDPISFGKKAELLDLNIVYVINTHSHHDHSAGNLYFKEKFSASVVAHESVPASDIRVKHGQTLLLGQLTLSFLHTPGHTTDSLCVLVNQELMTGDTLFVGKVGGTYAVREAREEFESLKELMKLEDGIRVWPGHDYGIHPHSTIGEERRSNPFIIRLNDFNDFIWLKDNWLDYKREHNIQ
jgi:glyoxylase-like metal-dependent hydrolase (beta-lactamase superfamily II)